MSRRRLGYPLAVAATLTLVGGLAATLLLFVSVSRLEYDRMRLGFQQRASVRVAAVDQGLTDAVEVVKVLNQLFSTVQPVTREQFHNFTQPLLARYPFIQAFNHHRWIEDSERPAVEAELGKLIPGLQIHERRADLTEVAPQRERYLIVDFLEPLQGNEAALGLDVSVNARVMAALDQAVVTQQPAATGLLSLAQDKRPLTGLSVIMPVYRPGMPLGSSSQRRAALIGDTAAILHASRLVHTIFEDAQLQGDALVAVAVFASDAPQSDRLVYSSSNALPEDFLAPAEPDSESARGLLAVRAWFNPDYNSRVARTINVAGQPWHVVVAAAPRAFLQDHLGSLTTLIGGILFSVLMTAFVQTLVQRSRRVQALVEERTADLKRSNRQLLEDVIIRRRTEHALQESEQRFRQLVTMSSDWYWEQDRDLRYTMVTGGILEKGGIPADMLIGRTRWETVDGMAESEEGRAHIALVEAHQPFTNFEYRRVDLNGDERWYCVTGEPLFDEHGQFAGYRGTGTDVTARKVSEQRIHHVAQHDVLTGLPNRSLLQDRLSQAVAFASRTGKQVWVMLIDLDRFKFVNDSMGHKAGDVLLMTVASRLRGALREADTVARLSGDEFVAILNEHNDEPLTADIVQRLMDAVAQPVMLGSSQFLVTCSIGVAVYPTDGTPADYLIEHADIAMYRAKKLGRNNFQFYTPAMNEEAMERVRIESALRSALERNEFVLHYQPQVDLESGAIVGMEALIRWKHPELGMVPPNRFISVAEETGLIIPIGAWVLRTACQQARAWQDAGLGQLRVAVNLSARQFSTPHLVSDIEQVLADTGLPPASLEIELTESLFMSDVDQAVDLLHQLKGVGVQLSIDDFGTGYSSLSYLSRFPIDVLKIDRSFVCDISRDASDAAIVASIITLAHNLKLSVIAEGVETGDQLSYLRRHGCDQMQGYYFSKPLPSAEFEDLLRSHLAETAHDRPALAPAA